ncbi:uncharacterized protein LOC120171143 [Hibiscus syriacus]|uniref:uncharacterized protein LOC120171143 n=1 Tax=Hibiscus syriacus TaxID=106335 RepID=UPI0019217CD2|nr:uncharacterized protein LOC120171143 [Hibiscus syriacus]
MEESPLWKTIMGYNGFLWVKNFMWIVCKGSLLSNERRVRRHMSPDGSYLECGGEFESVLQKSFCMLQELLRACVQDQQTKRMVVSSSQWQPPRYGWFKLNMHGSRRTNSGLSTCGGVLQDSMGSWVAGFSKSIGICSTLEAELWGILERLMLAWDS